METVRKTKRRRSQSDFVLEHLEKHTFAGLRHLSERLRDEQAGLATHLASELAAALGFILLQEPPEGCAYVLVKGQDHEVGDARADDSG